MKDLVLEFYKKLLEGATIEDLGELPFGDEDNKEKFDTYPEDIYTWNEPDTPEESKLFRYLTQYLGSGYGNISLENLFQDFDITKAKKKFPKIFKPTENIGHPLYRTTFKGISDIYDILLQSKYDGFDGFVYDKPITISFNRDIQSWTTSCQKALSIARSNKLPPHAYSILFPIPTIIIYKVNKNTFMNQNFIDSVNGFHEKEVFNWDKNITTDSIYFLFNVKSINCLENYYSKNPKKAIKIIKYLRSEYLKHSSRGSNNNLEKGLRLLYDKVIEDGNETE
jgi:hypothetical protein